MTSDRALAVYGTLAPGESNHHVMLGIDGHWQPGFIRGYQFEITWGEANGYPGVCLDQGGSLIPVNVFVSDQLDKHWNRLEAFEGPGYRRVSVDVLSEADQTEVIGTAYVFEALTDNDD